MGKARLTLEPDFRMGKARLTIEPDFRMGNARLTLKPDFRAYRGHKKYTQTMNSKCY
jgi:hypothetical protein